MKIKEVINIETLTAKAPKPINWKTAIGGYVGDFVYNGVTYTIAINDHTDVTNSPKIYSVDFSVLLNGSRSINTTNFGDNYKVLGIVANEARDKIIQEKLDPDVIVVKISKDLSDNTSREIASRQKLYDRMMNKFAKPLGFSHSTGWVNSRVYSSNIYTKRKLEDAELQLTRFQMSRKA